MCSQEATSPLMIPSSLVGENSHEDSTVLSLREAEKEIR